MRFADRIDEFITIMGGVPVDTRDPAEYQAGHLPGAINVPLPDPNAIDDLRAARAGYQGTVLFILHGQNTPGPLVVNGALALESDGYRGIVIYSGGVDRVDAEHTKVFVMYGKVDNVPPSSEWYAPARARREGGGR